MSVLTGKQALAWPEAIKRLKASGADGIAEDFRSWDVVWSEETRPGRGHFINATYVNGEIFAQVLMDVYGYPSVSFATLDWVHADANEECDCEPCETYRTEEAAS